MAQFNNFRLADSIEAGQNLAMNRYRLDETSRQIQARQGLETALSSGTPEAMTAYSKQFPIEAQQYQEAQGESNERKLQRALNQISVIEKVASGVGDEQSYQRGKQLLQSLNIDTSQFPPNYDPEWVKQQMEQTLGYKGQIEMAQREEQKRFEREKFDETKRHNREMEKRESGAEGGKPPAGYRWAADGNLEPIPGGPATKPTESQQKQLTGVTNLQNAADEYINHLQSWGSLDILSPDARAAMGTKYNNMMLQAKEAYNLGVLNGPDFEILQRVVTDPRTLTGAITSNEALANQARELKRIMSTIGQTAATGQLRDMSVKSPNYQGQVKRTWEEDGYVYRELPDGTVQRKKK